MDQTAKFHDPLVDLLMDMGLPYDLVNYPTMLPSYGAACIYNSLTDYDEPTWNHRSKKLSKSPF